MTESIIENKYLCSNLIDNLALIFQEVTVIY